ncbi:MAG: NCS2 family permease, partial [Propionibacteriaceae bacterium]|nr:NCS2 family permease [Propionibacteriaceae bacterium]
MVTNSPKAVKHPQQGPQAGSSSGLDRYFEITKRKSTIGREVRGGLVTFFAMAYIIALNPLIIGTTADRNGNLISGLPATPENMGASIAMVAAGTALIAGVMTIVMGVLGRFPLGLAAGLGLNALLAYVIAPRMTWPQA